MSQATSDLHLIARAQKGDREAFRGLVERYQRRVYWTAYHIVHRHEDAQDVSQEAFLRVFRFLDRFDPAQRFSTWLYQIVVNVAIDSLRRKKGTRSASLAAVGELKDPRSDPFEEAQRSERRQKVREILRRVPEVYRVVLVLRDIEGLPSREVAEVLGVNHATVRWRLHRARALFKEAWEAKFGIDSPVEG